MASGAKDLAQGRHLNVQRGFLDHHLRPYAVEQFVFGDEMFRPDRLSAASNRTRAGAAKSLRRPSAAVGLSGCSSKGPKR